jgi:hypothetical protein
MIIGGRHCPWTHGEAEMMRDGLVEISKKASKTTATMKMIYTMINEVELYRDDQTPRLLYQSLFPHFKNSPFSRQNP